MTEEDNEVPQRQVPDLFFPTPSAQVTPPAGLQSGDGMAPMPPSPYLRCR